MNLHDILKISNGEIINGNILEQKIGNIQIDSRKVEINDIFICIKGKNDDGHNYIKEIENGTAYSTLGEEEKQALQKAISSDED